MTDATNWVTVKVPEGDREQAAEYKPDGVTWGDCLVAGAERLNDGLDSDTRRFEPDGATAGVDEIVDVLTDELGSRDADVADRIDGVEMAIQELTDQVQSVKRTLEDLGGRR